MGYDPRGSCYYLPHELGEAAVFDLIFELNTREMPFTEWMARVQYVCALWHMVEEELEAGEVCKNSVHRSRSVVQ